MGARNSSCGHVTFRSSTSISFSSRYKTGSSACISCIGGGIGGGSGGGIGGGIGSGVGGGIGDCNVINIDYITNNFLLKFLFERIDSLMFITCLSQFLLSSEWSY